MFVDLASVRVSGAISLPRARVLWKDGLLRMFTKEGIVWEAPARAPKAVPSRWYKLWHVDTDRGEIVLRNRCSTCGGWRSVTKVPAETLWERML